MNKRVIAVFVATVLAVGGALLVVLYAKNAERRAIAAQQPTTVYVAQKLIPSGTTLKDAERTELLAETQVAAKAVPLGALRDLDPDTKALLALSDVQPGEVLLKARFGPKPVGTKAIEVPTGKVAVSVELEDPARVGRFVRPGSQIAIYMTYKKVKLGLDEASKNYNSFNFKGTRVLLDNVQVIGMGETPLSAPSTTSDDADADKTKDRKSPSFLVTVAVTTDESIRLVHGINTYTLYASLRGSDVKFTPGYESGDDGVSIRPDVVVP